MHNHSQSDCCIQPPAQPEKKNTHLLWWLCIYSSGPKIKRDLDKDIDSLAQNCGNSSALAMKLVHFVLNYIHMIY